MTPHVLVVEDEEETAATLKRKLEAECYAVDVEHDGEKGFYKARTNGYDLILLDKGLPGKNGYEICSGLREYKITTPVLILSVAAEIEVIGPDYINEAYDRVVASDVRYRFVIDTESLRDA